MRGFQRDVFSTRLRDLLNRSGISQVELAKLTDIPREIVSYYCNGGRKPNVENVIKIAEHFGVSADYLLGLTDEIIKVDYYISAFDAAKIATNLPDDVVKRILSDENFRLAITNLAKYL